MDIAPDPKTIPVRTVDRYYALVPRLADLARHLRLSGNGAAPATGVERALGHELLREARSVTSRDGFGRNLRVPRQGEPLTRDALLLLVGEAELALAAFSTLYRDIATEAEEEDTGPLWKYRD